MCGPPWRPWTDPTLTCSMLTWPRSAASISAVAPSSLVASTSAPAVNSTLAASARPRAATAGSAARCPSAVGFTLAPAAKM
eukprot:2065460-Pyramimonas_sp.AAC.2